MSLAKANITETQRPLGPEVKTDRRERLDDIE